MLKIILIVAFLLSIAYNLFAGLYYMMQDKNQGKRTVKSLTWRIGLSVALFAIILIGMATGLIDSNL